MGYTDYPVLLKLEFHNMIFVSSLSSIPNYFRIIRHLIQVKDALTKSSSHPSQNAASAERAYYTMEVFPAR